MSDNPQPALVLDDPSVSHSEPVHFGGFPGLWAVDRPIAVSELGFDSVDDAYARADELGLPLARTTVAFGDGLMPARDNHLPGAHEVGPDWKPAPGQPGAELGPGETFPPSPMSASEVLDEIAPALEPNADEVIAAVELVDDAATLNAMRASEAAGKARKTVLAALDARLEQVAPDEEETA